MKAKDIYCLLSTLPSNPFKGLIGIKD